MATIRRLTNSCVLVDSDSGVTLFDPGFPTWESADVDLSSLGPVDRVLITHEHADHVSPEFVAWLVGRRSDVTVYANDAVAGLLAGHDVAVATGIPPGFSGEDVLHERIPTGATPPNRAWTIDGVFTHPGDSYAPTVTAPVLALPLLIPWGSTTKSVEFARRLGPQQVIPIHDFYLSASGREWIAGLARSVLAPDIELVPLGWGDAYTV